jgi:hypothetical protein
LQRPIVPRGEIEKLEEIAGAILYPTTKAGAFLNGSVIIADGGRLGTLASTYYWNLLLNVDNQINARRKRRESLK